MCSCCQKTILVLQPGIQAFAAPLLMGQIQLGSDLSNLWGRYKKTDKRGEGGKLVYQYVPTTKEGCETIKKETFLRQNFQKKRACSRDQGGGTKYLHCQTTLLTYLAK